MARVHVFAWLLLPLPLLLLPALPTVFLSGHVQSDNARPLAGALVRVQGQAACTRSGADGIFRLPGKLPAGARLTASLPGRRIAWLDAPPLAFELTPLPADDNDAYEWIAPGPDPRRPNNCANCHAEIHREWAGSAHGRAADNVKFLALLEGTDGTRPPRPDWNMRAQNPDGIGVCIACHAPTFRDPTLEYNVRSLKDASARGVHCDYCHKIADAPIDKLGTRFGRDGYPLLRPRDGDLLTVGPLDDAVRPGESFAHAPFYKESRYCASCHEGVVFGNHAYGTYSEWLQSPAKKAGTECQHCHMTPTGTMTNIAPGHGGIERDPRTLASHDLPGGTEAMLRQCVKMSVDHGRRGEQVAVTVELRADNVGHRVPTGFIDRHLILVVEVLDHKGEPIAVIHGSKLDAATGPSLAGKAGYLYAKRLRGDGRSPSPFWLPADDVTDTRLEPGKPDRRTFVFPAAAQSVRVRLLYRRLWPEVADRFHWADNEVLVREARLRIDG